MCRGCAQLESIRESLVTDARAVKILMLPTAVNLLPLMSKTFGQFATTKQDAQGESMELHTGLRSTPATGVVGCPLAWSRELEKGIRYLGRRRAILQYQEVQVPRYLDLGTQPDDKTSRNTKLWTSKKQCGAGGSHETAVRMNGVQAIRVIVAHDDQQSRKINRSGTWT